MSPRSGGCVVIGIGNEFRRDDGIGPAVAASLAARGAPAVACAAEPTAILDAWEGAALAILVDAVDGPVPGRIRRCTIAELTECAPVSSHDLGVRQTYELGRALGRTPEALVVVVVDVADTGHGVGLSPPVAAALPAAVRLVESVLSQQTGEPADQQS